MEFVITAGLFGLPSWSAAQDMTGRILRSFAIGQAFEVDSLLVKGLYSLYVLLLIYSQGLYSGGHVV